MGSCNSMKSRGRLNIHRIWTQEFGRRNGSMMLRTLCELADRHGVEMRLKVVPFGRKPYPLSRLQLKNWYERHGFQGEGWKMWRAPSLAWCTTNATAKQIRAGEHDGRA